MSRQSEAVLEMEIEDRLLRENGLLDPDEPTQWGHYLHNKRARAPFTPTERQLIRNELGL